MNKYAIKLDKLTKHFKQAQAVQGISFKVRTGEMFGFLGPNGAGKTTTINMLSTLLKPTSGTAEVAGYDIIKDKKQVRNNIGIVFQEPALDIKLTGRENLIFHAMLYGINRKEHRIKIDEVLNLVDLSTRAEHLVETYSTGMKRRLEIARGLLHDPRVLFLDEPTLGLDAQTRRNIWEYIKGLNQAKKVSIILTTHYMEEADYLCDRIAIIDNGHIIALDTAEKLKNIVGGDIVVMDLTKDGALLESEFIKLDWIKDIKKERNCLHLTVEQGETKIPILMGIAHKLEVNVQAITLHKPSLEDVFLYYTGKNMRE